MSNNENQITVDTPDVSNDVYYVYTIYDKVAKHYLPTFECRTHGVAIREFKRGFATDANLSAEDFDLYCVGCISRKDGFHGVFYDNLDKIHQGGVKDA